MFDLAFWLFFDCIFSLFKCMFLMVCTMKDSNTFLTFCLFLISHILPLARHNVATSRDKPYQTCSPSFQFRQLSEVYDICIVPVFFSRFSPISPVQDYIYSKYRTQLTQLNNNTHLKNLASNQIRRCRVRNSKFVLLLFLFFLFFFFSLYARKHIRIFCLIIA